MQNIKNLFNKTLSRRLLSVFVLTHAMDDEVDLSSIESLLLLFEDNYQLRIGCDLDGESILIDNKTPSESDMKEYGRNVLYNISSHEQIKSAIGETIDFIEVIVEGDIMFGVSMRFNDFCCITAINLGNELYLYNDIPSKILAEGGHKLRV